MCKNQTTTNPPTRIIDNEIYLALIDENEKLRELLSVVSSVGISAMFHTHRSDAERFNRSVLKGVAEIMQGVKAGELQDIYQQGYELASSPSVLDQFEHPHLKGLESHP